MSDERYAVIPIEYMSVRELLCHFICKLMGVLRSGSHLRLIRRYVDIEVTKAHILSDQARPIVASIGCPSRDRISQESMHKYQDLAVLIGGSYKSSRPRRTARLEPCTARSEQWHQNETGEESVHGHRAGRRPPTAGGGLRTAD